MEVEKSTYHFILTEWFFYEIENKNVKILRHTQEDRFKKFITTGIITVKDFSENKNPTTAMKFFIKVLNKLKIPHRINAKKDTRILESIILDDNIKVYWNKEVIRDYK